MAEAAKVEENAKVTPDVDSKIKVGRLAVRPPKKRGKRTRSDDHDNVVCIKCCNKMDDVYVVSSSKGSDLCVACVINEAINYASSRGWVPGCTVKNFDTQCSENYYDPSKITTIFNGGWADFYYGENKK
jgi:hypothetical protein